MMTMMMTTYRTSISLLKKTTNPEGGRFTPPSFIMRYAITLLLFLLASPVYSQATFSVDPGWCNEDKNAVHEYLIDEHGVQPLVILEMDANPHHFELWTSFDKGKWVYVYENDDKKCILFIGENWEKGEPVEIERGNEL